LCASLLGLASYSSHLAKCAYQKCWMHHHIQCQSASRLQTRRVSRCVCTGRGYSKLGKSMGGMGACVRAFLCAVNTMLDCC
jgi:hypothetical protein